MDPVMDMHSSLCLFLCWFHSTNHHHFSSLHPCSQSTTWCLFRDSLMKMSIHVLLVCIWCCLFMFCMRNLVILTPLLLASVSWRDSIALLLQNHSSWVDSNLPTVTVVLLKNWSTFLNITRFASSSTAFLVILLHSWQSHSQFFLCLVFSVTKQVSESFPCDLELLIFLSDVLSFLGRERKDAAEKIGIESLVLSSCCRKEKEAFLLKKRNTFLLTAWSHLISCLSSLISLFNPSRPLTQENPDSSYVAWKLSASWQEVDSFCYPHPIMWVILYFSVKNKSLK